MAKTLYNNNKHTNLKELDIKELDIIYYQSSTKYAQISSLR